MKIIIAMSLFLPMMFLPQTEVDVQVFVYVDENNNGQFDQIESLSNTCNRNVCVSRLTVNQHNGTRLVVTNLTDNLTKPFTVDMGELVNIKSELTIGSKTYFAETNATFGTNNSVIYLAH